MKEESENPGKHHDDEGAINDDAEENGLGDDDNFDNFDDNEDVTREADEAYMDVLNNITGRENNVIQFLMGEDWDQDLDEDDEYYNIPLVVLIISSSWVKSLGLHFKGIRSCTSGGKHVAISGSMRSD